MSSRLLHLVECKACASLQALVCTKTGLNLVFNMFLAFGRRIHCVGSYKNSSIKSVYVLSRQVAHSHHTKARFVRMLGA
jgi:hypothetical protein